MATKLKKAGIGCGVLVIAVGGFFFLTEPGRAILDIWRTGAVQAAMSEPEQRAYNASTENNLKAIYTAMKIYEESEGQFPDSSGWMDAIRTRMEVNDMSEEEAEKKLISPAVTGKKGEFGYAMNSAASGKYSGDLDPKMPLIFDSKDTKRNASGTPESLLPVPPRAGQNMAITVDGSLLKL
jgi:hypothetical protein